jgi:hypothetical protein
MPMKLLAAAAALSLMTGAAFAATGTNNPTNVQPDGSQTSTEFSQTSRIMGGYRPNVAATPGESRHVIGGETFYFGSDVGPGGGDGAD